MNGKALSAGELMAVAPGEALTISAVMAVIVIGVMAVVIYKLFTSNKGSSKFGGYTFEWKD